MNIRYAFRTRFLLLSLWASTGLQFPLAKAEVTFEASWELPSYAQVRDEMLAWLDSAGLEKEVGFRARALWPEANLRASDGTALIDRAVETFALAHLDAQALIEACNAPYFGPLPPPAEWLKDASLPPVLRNNLRLYYGRWLAQHALYDEVLRALEGLRAADVFDPAGLLFYHMVAYHQLVEPDESRSYLVRLLEQEEELPRRYLQVAQLLRRDLAGLKDESLDHVARRMNDVRRRLEIGRAGKQVQVIENGVVDSLDRIIKELEKQQQQQGGQVGGSQQSSTPMQDSQLPSLRAPMKVEQREIGTESGWGDLPDKEREQALQQIGREFPAHYRELIEQYFRELADESNNTPSR